MLLEVRNLQVCYGRRVAVSDVSLSVPAGQFVALLGANGAGKSTTLRAISGLAAISHGTVRFASDSLAGLPVHAIARRGIAHVPEGRGVLPRLTVEENLQAGALGHPEPARIGALREQVFGYFPVLRSRLGQPAGLLSGGEQQMLSLARALLKSPRLLMIDEMSLGLAPQVVEQLMQVLVELTRQGVSVLCVEQNTRLVLKYALHGYVLETGRSTIEGPGAQLLSDERIVKAYLGRAAGSTAR